MSGLLLLADAACKSQFTVACQTDPVAHADVSMSMHDYVRKADFDVLVNCIHDYYQRVAVPDHDAEHSYAFPVSNPSELESTFEADDNCCESLLDLNEFMGVTDNIFPAVDQSVFEEAVEEAADVDDWEEMVASLSADVLYADSTSVIEVGQNDFDELLTYLCHEDQSLSAPCNQTSVNIDVDNLCTPSDQLEDSANKQMQPISLDERIENGSRKCQSPLVFCQWNNCYDVFKDTPSFIAHIESEHVPLRASNNITFSPKMPKFCCWRGCPRTEPFSKRYLLMDHMATHYDLKPLSCPSCDMRFTTKSRLKIHKNRMHSEKSNYMECCTCKKRFFSTADLSRHKKTHLEIRKLLKCSTCDKSFHHLDALRKHIKIKHNE